MPKGVGFFCMIPFKIRTSTLLHSKFWDVETPVIHGSFRLRFQ